MRCCWIPSRASTTIGTMISEVTPLPSVEDEGQCSAEDALNLFEIGTNMGQDTGHQHEMVKQ